MGNHQSKAILIVTGFLGLSLMYLQMSDADGRGEDPDDGGVGLFNLGNTCFLNALLQAFSSSDSFTEHLSSLPSNVAQDTPQHDFAIVNQLQRVLTSLRTGKTHLVPDELVAHLTYKFPHFGQQQDSHEVYLVLHDAVTKAQHHPSLVSVLQDRHTHDPMIGLMSNTVTCLQCQNQTHTLQSFSYLYLDWKPTLAEALESMTDGETVEYECLKCSLLKTSKELHRQLSSSETNLMTQFQKDCERKRIRGLMASIQRASDSDDTSEAGFLIRSKYQAKLTHSIVRLPRVLCILVKRLLYSSAGYLTKVQTPMLFPMVLTLDNGLSVVVDPLLKDVAYEFRLTAMIEHAGTATGGHYFTYKRQNGGWLYLSDTAVHKVDEDSVLRGQAYMLFYEQTN